MHLDIMQSSFCLQSELLQPRYFFLLFSEKDGEETDEEKEAQEAFILACEHIRFSSLFAAGDVSRGGSSARNVPSGEEREETDVLAGYVYPDQDDALGNRQ